MLTSIQKVSCSRLILFNEFSPPIFSLSSVAAQHCTQCQACLNCSGMILLSACLAGHAQPVTTGLPNFCTRPLWPLLKQSKSFSSASVNLYWFHLSMIDLILDEYDLPAQLQLLHFLYACMVSKFKAATTVMGMNAQAVQWPFPCQNAMD